MQMLVLSNGNLFTTRLLAMVRDGASQHMPSALKSTKASEMWCWGGSAGLLRQWAWHRLHGMIVHITLAPGVHPTPLLACTLYALPLCFSASYALL